MDIPHGTAERLSRALGQAVVRIWSRLPHDVQHQLFEEVVTSHGEAIETQLAIFLHDKHPSTFDAVKAREMLEPDSLGG
jgi:hypothetical protein